MTLTTKQREEVISFASELIKLPGNSGEENQIAAAVESRMKKLGYDEVSVDPLGNVLGIIRGDRPGPSILFDGHMDVVPTGDLDLWNEDPYSGHVSEGKIRGRGASDMKGALASMIFAPAFADRSAISGTVMVSASVAEEIMVGSAFREILKRHRVDAVVIGEPTGLKIGTAEKGRASVEMTAFGTVAHSSRPDLGDNAVYRMMSAAERIRTMQLRECPLRGREVIELVEISSLPMPGSGSIPGECRSLWECRILDGETSEEFLGRWRRALEGLDRISLAIRRSTLPTYKGTELEMIDFLPGWQRDKDESFVGKTVKALKAVGQKVEFYAVPYGCNALVSAGEMKIPTVIIGPGDISLAHKPNESIDIDELIKGTEIYRALVCNT